MGAESPQRLGFLDQRDSMGVNENIINGENIVPYALLGSEFFG